jgi:hypothetical protein
MKMRAVNIPVQYAGVVKPYVSIHRILHLDMNIQLDIAGKNAKQEHRLTIVFVPNGCVSNNLTFYPTLSKVI